MFGACCFLFVFAGDFGMAIYTCESMSILQFLTASHMKPPRQLPEILVRCAIQLSPQVTVRLAASDDHNLGEHWCVAAFLPALPALPAATVGVPHIYIYIYKRRHAFCKICIPRYDKMKKKPEWWRQRNR